ncbi:MAG: hypothetical protein NC417_10545 [Candidatus Gastranaerophilales bacterium]|nr:hypothetical protein [Candidatus Gastranaerophilales bacterium]
MEYLWIAAAMAGVVLFIFLKEAYEARKREKLFKASLYRNYGKAPQKEYSPERYLRMDSFYRRHMREGQADDITWNDLDFDRVFRRIDCTLSASGEEYLYYMLRDLSRTEEELEHFEEAVRFFDHNADTRVRVQLLLHRLGHTGKFSLYDYLSNLDYLGERSNRKHIICDLLFVPFVALLPFSLVLGLLGMAVLMGYNILTYFKEKAEVEPYLCSFDYVLRLLEVCGRLEREQVDACEKEWDKLRRHRAALSPLKRGASLALSGNRAGASGNPLDLLLDYVKMVFHVDLIQFNRMLRELRNHLADVDELISCVGYVDAAIAVGSFRRSLTEGWCVPDFLENGGILLQNVYHPLLEQPVKNSVRAERGVLLTGSNASGKSTFLKTVALNLILGQTIHTCAADSCRMPRCSVYSSMALRDDLGKGESYYIVEIKALKRILDAVAKSGRKVLCFVDEVLRGTNTVERIAAANQILKSLTGERVQCFAATHDIEMTYLLEGEYDNYHFEELVEDQDIAFPYLLVEGRATARNAIRLLGIMGYDKQIIEKAEEQAKRFVDSGLWS